VTVAIYTVASVAGGLTMGAGAGAVGALLSRIWRPSVAGVLLLIALASVAAAVLDGGRGHARVPGVQRQVNEEWLRRYRSWVYALAFGFQLGFGVITIVTSAAVYLTAAVALLSASPAVGGMIGAVFGLFRALPVLATRRVASSGRLQRLHRRLHQLGPTARTATFTLEVAVTAAATGLAIGLAR
jgi:sulfite exporter TauE/SafE